MNDNDPLLIQWLKALCGWSMFALATLGSLSLFFISHNSGFAWFCGWFAGSLMTGYHYRYGSGRRLL